MKGRNASHGRQIVYRQRIYTEPPLDKISTRCLLTCEYTNKLMMVFLSAFIKLRKATVSFVMCVCVCPTTLAPNRRILMKFNICLFFRKSVEKIQIIQVSLKLTRMTVTLHEGLCLLG